MTRPPTRHGPKAGQAQAGPSGGGTALAKSKAAVAVSPPAPPEAPAPAPSKQPANKTKKAASVEPAVPLDPVELEKRMQSTLSLLQQTEQQIYHLETQYLENANSQANALRGYEALQPGMLISGGSKKANWKAEDRIFSASSVTGQAHLPTGEGGVEAAGSIRGLSPGA